MKKILFFVFLCSFYFSNGQSIVKGPELSFVSEHLDLGEVKRGEKRTFKYEFTNTGDEAIVFNIVSGCDCTTLDWPRKPIEVGQKGVIDVIFDSTEKEESETVDVDIYLDNIDPKTKHPFFKIIDYRFVLID